MRKLELDMTSPDTPSQQNYAQATAPVKHYALGDSLKWNAPWIDVRLWTELPFWLMTDNSTIPVECEGHEFQVAVQDNYFELFFGAATDSRTTVGYRGPMKTRENLPQAVKQAMDPHPDGPYMWRKCKTYLKVGSRCNEDVWNVLTNQEPPRANEAKQYISDLCGAHIPVINRLIRAYRLATYDYFAFEVSAWDVPLWVIERDGHAVSSMLVNYREWDSKPLIYKFEDPTQKPKVYKLVDADDLRNQISLLATPGELELLDALNFMERGDYSGAVRRVTTAIEVIVEDVAGKA